MNRAAYETAGKNMGKSKTCTYNFTEQQSKAAIHEGMGKAPVRKMDWTKTTYALCKKVQWIMQKSPMDNAKMSNGLDENDLCIMQKCPMESAKMSNGKCKNVQWIVQKCPTNTRYIYK